jgi:chromosome segregation protein
MFLQRLEIHGFKSFANKSEMEFLLPKNGTRGITAIVGPNGSGKSNVVDSLRWVMGEQSMKTIRGKKSEDIIFSGSGKKAQAGFAEVSLILDNEKQNGIDYPEVMLTRRIYRSGESEYLLNKKKTRLADIQLMLAKSNIGSKSYSIVGQGTIDKILTLSEEERKDFFNEAAGIKQYQIKKEQSISKLEGTKKNLEQAEIILRELEPRLRQLRRQAKRLEERELTEKELHELEFGYYGSAWKELTENIGLVSEKVKKFEERWNEKRGEIKDIQEEFATLQKEKPASESFFSLQIEYQKLADEKSKLREKEWELKIMAEKDSTPQSTRAAIISFNRAIEEISALSANQEKIIEKIKQILESAKDGKINEEKIKNLSEELQALGKETKKLLREMKGEPSSASAEASAGKGRDFEKKLGELKDQIIKIEEKMAGLREEIQNLAKKDEEKKKGFFEKQRKLDTRQNEIFSVERDLNDAKIELARLETRKEALESEMKTELKDRFDEIKLSEAKLPTSNHEEFFKNIQRLRYQLEQIGGIDPEIAKEHKETEERFEFLNNQSEDLRQSSASLREVIKELNEIIETQFNEAFVKINENFNRYFGILFNGGAAKITKTAVKKEESENEIPDADTKIEKEKNYTIEIQATPPGKKIKNLEMLSGGEKALTAIALLCAIMANNPSPFVILDEVDAALDESNTIKFANILAELSKNTQFVVITHNRATMEKASILYGVTMEVEGISKLLSIKLEEGEQLAR